MNNHPFLVNEEFIAYLPSLGKALGSIEDAVTVQWLWFKRDRETEETEATAAQIADAIGMSESTLKKRLTRLKKTGVLSARRRSSFDSTSVWTVHRDKIPTTVSAGRAREDQIGTPGRTDPAHPESADLDRSGRTKSALPLSKNRKNEPKNGGGTSVVVDPPVTGGRPTTTPDEHLDAAGLAARDRGRFKTWLREVRNARNPNAVILTEAGTGELAESVREWRRSLDVETEPDAEPADCPHGLDIALGEHMCPQCDPARRGTRPPADVEPEGRPAPDWMRDLRSRAESDPAAWRALSAADETTPGGVTPSILEGAPSGARQGA